MAGFQFPNRSRTPDSRSHLSSLFAQALKPTNRQAAHGKIYLATGAATYYLRVRTLMYFLAGLPPSVLLPPAGLLPEDRETEAVSRFWA